MSLPPSVPQQSSWVQPLHRFYEERFKRVPTALGYAAARTKETWDADVPSLTGKNVLSPLVHTALSVPGKAGMELSHFSFTPSFFRATIPHLPTGWSLIMFYGAMIPARMHSEALRAPTYIDENNQERKDYRGIRDVFVRDMLSIGIFLLALAPVNQLMRTKMQLDGSILSLGQDKNVPQLSVMSTPFNPLKELTPYSYPQLSQVYDVTKHPHKLFALLMTDARHRRVGSIVSERIEAISISQGRLALNTNLLKKQTTLLTKEFGYLQHQQHKLYALIKDALFVESGNRINQTPEKAMQALQLLPFNQISVSKKLHPTLTTEQRALKLSETLVASIADAIQEREQSLQPLLSKAAQWKQQDSRDVAQLGSALTTLIEKQSHTALQSVSRYGNNHHGVLDALLQEQKKTLSNTEARTFNYPQAFDALHHELQHTMDVVSEVAALKALQHGLGITKSHAAGDTASGSTLHQAGVCFVEALDASERVTTTINSLDSELTRLRQQGAKIGSKFAGLIQLDNFVPSQFLVEHAKGLRAPADAMSFVFVATIMGFFPVWLNQVWSDTEFKLKQLRKKPSATATKPVPTQTHTTVKTEKPNVASNHFSHSV